MGILSLRPNSYANAKSWDDLVHAFAESLKNSSLDEMVLLLHAANSGPREKLPAYVRPVSYERLEEIPQLLRSMAPGASGTGDASGGRMLR